MDTGTEIDSIRVVEQEVTLLLRLAESARTEGDLLDRSAYLLLRELASRGPLGIAVLAQAFQVDISTASRQTARLEEKGFVERMADPADGRVSLLRITLLGQTQFSAAQEARHALFSNLLADWPADDLLQFGAYLSRLNQAIVRRRQMLADTPPGE